MNQESAQISERASTRRETTRAEGPDLMRALAILLVMLWHLPKAATPTLLNAVKPFGWVGVDLFFVLSGYLIGSQLLAVAARGERPSLRVFYVRRSLRILPAFLVVVALYFLVPMARDNATIQPAWRFLTFTMNFGLDLHRTGAFTQAWSLCVEEHFYLVLPLLVLAFRQARSPAPVIAVAAVVLLGGMIVRAELWHHALDARLAAQNYKGLTAIFLKDVYYPTYCRLDGLLFGVLLAAVKVFRPEWWRRYADSRLTFVLGGAAILVSCTLFHYTSTYPPNIFRGTLLSLTGAVAGYPLFSLGTALILASLIKWGGVLDRWRIPGVGAVAVLSYSIYLTHKSVWHLDQLWFAPEYLRGLKGFAVYFLSSFLVAAALWLLVERPFLLLRDRLVRRVRRPSRIVEGALPS